MRLGGRASVQRQRVKRDIRRDTFPELRARFVIKIPRKPPYAEILSSPLNHRFPFKPLIKMEI
jgi:hypothetical protein